MRLPTRAGTTLSLVLAAHPAQTLLITAGLAVAALLSGRPLRGVALVATTVLAGRVTASWMNDVADRERDRHAGRSDKPVAREWVHPSTVTFATACLTCLVVPL